jgi:uncharacterized protein (TIGR00255 family)
MNSMTGFGEGNVQTPALSVRVELSAVNRKTLDLLISLPRAYSAWEARCQKVLQPFFHRGRVQAKVAVSAATGGGGWTLDAGKAAGILRQINALAAQEGLEPIRGVSELLRVPQMWREQNGEDDDETEAAWPLLESALQTAVAGLCAMRAREGEHLRGVLAGLLEGIGAVVEEIEPLVEPAKAELEDKLRASVVKLGSLSADMEARLLQEIALYGERSDVREEIDRIRGHVDQCREKLDAAEPVGRSLDFLCQELAREFNTLSVKSNRSDINRLALLGKERVEMFREQVQNVE